MGIDEDTLKLRKKAGIISLCTGFLMFVIETVAYYLTDSVAIFSNAAVSFVHLGALSFVVFSIHYSSKPPDEKHPYGHGKIENFSIGFEGALIFVAGLGIIYQSTKSFLYGHQISNMNLGIIFTLSVTIINFSLFLYLKFIAKKTESSILDADSKHALSDAYTSGASLLGILLIYLTELIILDLFIAMVVAIHLLYTGWQLLRSAFAKLMDKANPELIEKVVSILNQIREEEWGDVHNLKIRSNGDRIYIDFHLTLPAEWTILRSHKTIDYIESALLRGLNKKGNVMIHLDPDRNEIINDPHAVKHIRQRSFTLKSVIRDVPHHVVKAS